MKPRASNEKTRNAPRHDPAPHAERPLADLDRRARERLLDKLIQFVDRADPADINYAQLARAIRDLAAPTRAKVGAQPPSAVSRDADPQPASRHRASRTDQEITDGPRAPVARHRPDAPVRTAENKFLRSIFGDRVDIARTLLDTAFADIYGLELPPETPPPPPAPPAPSRGNGRDEGGAPRSPAGALRGTPSRAVNAAAPTSTANTPRGPPSPATSASAPAPD